MLPYISETISNNIKRYIISHQLPIRPVFTPGSKLRDIFCSSRPYDKKTCYNRSCCICPNFSDNSDCSILGPVYKIICNLCQQVYIGETSRTAHERLMEHRRYATSPDTYPEEALSVHYKEFHRLSPDKDEPNKAAYVKPDLTFSILCRELSTVKRKIKEAFYIVNQKPEINNKEECSVLERYLVN